MVSSLTRVTMMILCGAWLCRALLRRLMMGPPCLIWELWLSRLGFLLSICALRVWVVFRLT